MKLKDFAYDLPKNLIAQKPIRPRDQSRLLVLDRASGEIKHRYFYDIINYLNRGDVLVLNNTKVMPARLIGRKAETGGKVEVFLLKKTLLNPPLSGGRAEVWQCLVGGKKRKASLRVEFARGLRAEILKNNLDGTLASSGPAQDKSLGAGTWQVKFNKSGASFLKIVEKIGRTPLPPYIKRPAFAKAMAGKQDSIASLQNDKSCYQTVYANEKKLGSVAAPTAGFHFTPALLKKIKNKGVRLEYVTLQVGLGTFAPVKTDDITKHKMHSEWVEVSKKTLKNIIKAKAEGGRIIAVGTTSARTLESIFKDKNFSVKDYAAWTNIFIYPGYKFRAVDAIITNFHLPKSTLLMLVSAFAGRREILSAYRKAIKKKYRFYSYGDAMLII